MVPIALGMAVGGAGYKIGFMINNPVLGTTIAGVGLAKSALMD